MDHFSNPLTKTSLDYFERQEDFIEFLLTMKPTQLLPEQKLRELVRNLLIDTSSSKVINEWYAKYQQVNYTPFELITEDVFEEYANYMSYFPQCEAELWKAKHLMFSRSFSDTFLDLLTMSENRLFKFFSKDQILYNFFGKYDLKSLFPIYADSMKKRFFKAVQKRKIFEMGAREMCKYLPIFKPTDTIIEDILFEVLIKK